MAGIPVVYPDTLPHPQVGQFTPRERRATNREFMRPISRDRAGVRSVAFIFTPDQAREFREWYAEWLSMGGGFFAAPWPMPWGRGPHVFRFVEPPSWQLVGGAINGQGYWRVTADVELRGRGEMPELEVLVITSKIYPYGLIEEIQSSVPIFKDVPPVFWNEDVGTTAPLFKNGTLRLPIVEYEDWPVEDVETTTPIFANGTLRAPIVTYSDWPVEDVETTMPEFADGTLKVLLITYSNWPTQIEDEEVTTTVPVFNNGTLT